MIVHATLTPVKHNTRSWAPQGIFGRSVSILLDPQVPIATVTFRARMVELVDTLA